MPHIEWNDKFSVGHAAIDDQHKKWIDIHNKLHEILISGSPDDVSTSTIDTLEAMQAYAKKHFAFEEEYLETIAYPDRRQHSSLHHSFEGIIEGYLDDIKNGTILLNSEIMKLLKSWLENHILNEDMKYSGFVSGG